MTQFAILRTAKLKTYGNIGGAGAHNNRTRETPNADPGIQNVKLRGSNDLVSDVKARLGVLSKPPRKNAVLAVETLLTASPEFFKGKTDAEILAWAEYSLESMKLFWGEENVVAADLHLDESTPHIHVVSVPIADGKLSCREFLGGRKNKSYRGGCEGQKQVISQ